MPPATSAARSRAATPRAARRRTPPGTWVLLGVPALLGIVLLWQVASNLMRTQMAGREAAAIGRVTLEADPVGARIALVMVDRVGRETAFSGEMTIKLREPDGAVWQTTRTLSANDFALLGGTGLLSGRLGYAVQVSRTDWARAPRPSGVATVTVSAQPTAGEPFSTVAEERFP